MQPDYRASVRRGLIWGIVIAGHIGLVAWLYAMHAVPDYQERRNLQAEAMDAMRAQFLSVPRKSPGPMLKQPSIIPRVRTAAPRKQRAPPPVPTGSLMPVAGLPSEQPFKPLVDPLAPAGADGTNVGSLPHYAGNPNLHQPGRNAGPKLPGADDGAFAKTFHVLNEPSISDNLHGVGQYMSCSLIEMKRNKAGGGLDPAIARAYTELGCTK
jgi:hypothetical protein